MSLAKRVTVTHVARRTSRVVRHASYVTVRHAYLTYIHRTSHTYTVPHLTPYLTYLTPSYRTYTTRPPTLVPTTLSRTLRNPRDQKDAILFFLVTVRWLFKSYVAGVDGEQGAEAGDHGESASMRTLK